MLIVLATSPRVAPGLLSWPAWQALRSAAAVLAAAGHPLLPALDEARIAYRVVDELDAEPPASDGLAVWLPTPGADQPLPAGAQLIRGSVDLPGAHLLDLVATMNRLRVDCPWDARQTHQSLAPHLLEEAYEALEALESGDEQALCEELGDVLLQVMFHARIAAERDDGTGFTVDDVADGIVAKLVRRHPHVFGDVTVSGADEVKRNWDEIKREEKRALAERQGVPAAGQAAPSALDGVPFGQPALALAAQLQRRAARAGVPDELAGLDGETGGDIGAELFRLVAKARQAGLDPEMELRAAARRYRDEVMGWERSHRPRLSGHLARPGIWGRFLASGTCKPILPSTRLCRRGTRRLQHRLAPAHHCDLHGITALLICLGRVSLWCVRPQWVGGVDFL